MKSLRSCCVVPLLVIGAIVMVPILGHSQESTMTGTVTDATGAVIPGVSITATHIESGNTFQVATDERGNFRLPVRVGNYKVAAELPGFAAVNRNVQVLVGQADVNNFLL